jgi:hypothetical protein
MLHPLPLHRRAAPRDAAVPPWFHRLPWRPRTPNDTFYAGLRGIRVRSNVMFYTGLRTAGFQLTLGMYNTPELAAHE